MLGRQMSLTRWGRLDVSRQSAGQSLRDRIRQRQPIRLPISLYAVGWIQGLIQLAVFAGALAVLQSETEAVPVLLLSIAFGWAWFCLLMLGHDASHNAFVPWRPINQVIAFLALDCLLFGRASWLQGHHVIHHSRPFSKEDRMYLSANSVAGDLWNLLGMVLRYVAWDVKRLFQRPTWHEWLGMTVRLILLWLLTPLALIPAILFLLLFGNYLGLLAHSLPVSRRTADPVLRQLRTAWDLYPGSFIASLLTGGLNAHATHHVYPSLPRGAQPLATRILLEEAGTEYRRVHTLAGLWTLFRLRQYRTHEVASIEAIAANDLSLGIALLPSIQIRNTQQAFAPQPAGPLGVSTNTPVDLRKAERRLRQIAISFPERRQVDRRRASAQAAA
jgi:fatty acid desaturase